MRGFESALFAVLALRVAAMAAPRRRWGRALRVVADGAGFVALVGIAAIDGVRWQLMPAAGLAVALGLWDAVAWVRSRASRRPTRAPDPAGGGVRSSSGSPRSASVATRLGRVALGAVAVVAAFALAWALPVPRLPAPTGPYVVGSDAFEFAVPPRDDAGAADPSGLVVARARARVWYPAESGAITDAAPRAPWLEHARAMIPALAGGAGLPTWSLRHLALIRTHARWAAPASADGPFPVLSFDHGRRGFAAQNTFLAEELASRGWVVVAPEHPEGALRTVFRDGTVIDFDTGSFGGGLDGAAYAAAIHELGRRWAHTTRAAVAALAHGDALPQLAGRIDVARWVASGHSTGGGAAFTVCRDAPACDAVLGLDPWMLPAPAPWVAEAPEGVPALDILGLFSDPELGFFEPENRAAFDRLAAAAVEAGGRSESYALVGAGHTDLTDIGLLSPLAPYLDLYVGPLSPRRALPEIRRRVVRWLDGR